ncbi:MAG: glycosyltransferase family 4 protein [Raoultibacter sp.]
MNSVNRLKVIVVSQNYWPEPFNVHEMCVSLVEKGHDVTVLTGLPNYPEGIIPPEYRKGRNRTQNKDGVKIIRTSVIPRGDNLRGINLVKRALNYFSFAFTGSRKVKSLGSFDVVLSFEFSPMFMVEPAIKIAGLNKIPLIIYAIDLWPEDLLTGGVSKKSFIYKRMKKYSASRYAKADIIAVTSPDFKKYIKDYLGVKTSQYVFLPQYAEELFENLGKRKQTRNCESEFNITFAGNIGGNQAIEAAINAMCLLPSSSKAKLHLYGDGSRLAECKKLVKDKGISHRVVFYGRQPISEMSSVYEIADVMLLSLANPENGSLVPLYTIPRKLQSYMAAGKPILVFANGAANAVVKEAKCGYVCEGEKCTQLARIIIELEKMSSTDLAALGRNAKNYYINNYSKTGFAYTFNELVEGAVNDCKHGCI